MGFRRCGLLVECSSEQAEKAVAAARNYLRGSVGTANSWWLLISPLGANCIHLRVRGGLNFECIGQNECDWWLEHHRLGAEIARSLETRTLAYAHVDASAYYELAAQYSQDGKAVAFCEGGEGSATDACKTVLGNAGGNFPSSLEAIDALLGDAKVFLLEPYAHPSPVVYLSAPVAVGRPEGTARFVSISAATLQCLNYVSQEVALPTREVYRCLCQRLNATDHTATVFAPKNRVVDLLVGYFARMVQQEWPPLPKENHQLEVDYDTSSLVIGVAERSHTSEVAIVDALLFDR